MSTRFGRALLLYALLGGLGACRSKPQATERPAPSSSSVVSQPSPSTSTSASASAASKPSSVAEAQARAFVERWAETQNTHDFSAYSALYAERFTGVKRVGSYTKRFDRRGWLKDRQPMLREGVSVSVSNLQIAVAPGATRAIFTQDFSAPGFHDSGSKELFLTPLGSGLVVSREEMRGSRVTLNALASSRSVFAFDRDGPVLDSETSVAPQSQPHLLPRNKGDAYEVAVPLSPADVSEQPRALLGRPMTVYAKDGKQCSGSIARFELRVKAEPHFGMIQAWNGETDQPKASIVRIAAEIWGMAQDEERFVVGVLDHPCSGVWATAQPLAWVPAQAPAAPLRATALAAFKALPRYGELQAAFMAETPDSKHAWEEVDGAVSVVEVRAPAQPALVVVSAYGGTGCAGFTGTLSAIWKVGDSGALSLRQVIETSSDLLRVHGAVDAGFGLELLTGPAGFRDEVSALRPTASGYERRMLLMSSFWDCGC